ncbi:MFS transporter [Fulvimarina sp. 2208YS6-2-32]|uniref:MFS transporter n=1 Tax=Fulvimarina uroteuthidis TaxID=3098149 RepID=A0ABU5I5K4_9HYPH|nr:MFS transporter [Fulvimarina sp. 2208YS6-2-32]MDY8110657.1 MFS transporter [Fulvimarina sp. 2208YS6-2-32]
MRAARLIGALAHGTFWTVTGSPGAQIAPARHVGLATSIIFGGVSAASVLGVPPASFIGEIGGWRTAFGAIAALSLATAAAIAPSVPRAPASAPVSRRIVRCARGIRPGEGARRDDGGIVAKSVAAWSHWPDVGINRLLRFLCVSSAGGPTVMEKRYRAGFAHGKAASRFREKFVTSTATI